MKTLFAMAPRMPQDGLAGVHTPAGQNRSMAGHSRAARGIPADGSDPTSTPPPGGDR